MKNLPRILVIDDVLGSAGTKGNRDRAAFCNRLGLQDKTGDIVSETIKSPIANVVFLRGQRIDGAKVENDLAGALAAARKGADAYPRWALILLDMHFKTGEILKGEPRGRDSDRNPRRYFGMTLLKEFRNDSLLKRFPVVVLSSMNRSEIEQDFSNLGASDFRDKSALTRQILDQLLDEHGLIEDDVFMGKSLPLLQCLQQARRRSKVGNDNITLLGETGTGKEWLASYIHRKSGRSGRYIQLFTQGLPETLIEDRLFGHEKGGFTGADQAAPGAAELADKGTLFIDECGDIPLSIQAKLLRLLDKNTREAQRLGGQTTRVLDLQVVLATNRLDMLESDDFRKDLLFRAKVNDAVVIPPLRERTEDIPVLAEYFVRKYEQSFSAEKRTITDDAMALMMNYVWPGNVRELEKVIERAVFDFQGIRVLSASHLKLAAKPATTTGSFYAVKVDDGRNNARPNLPGEQSSPTLRHALETLASLPSAMLSPTEISGSMPRVQNATARLMLSLLRASLVATRKSTPENPEGDIYIHPAVKLLTGNSKVSASKAADIIKKIVGMDDKLSEFITGDPILNEALDIAMRLRPRPGRRSESAKQAETVKQ